jgi:HAE1 family hydrophobic/amphiphilic exporter-1
MKIWDVSIRQPVFMTMILVAGVVMGLFSYFRMPVDIFPNVEFPIVVVNTIWPGASPDEVQDQVTKPLEDELSTVPGIDKVTSTSAEGVSTLVLAFKLEASSDQVNEQVRERVNLLRNKLPTAIQDPIIRRFNPIDQPILLFGVSDRTGKLSPIALRKLVEDEIQAQIERVAGVAAADVSGGQQREIHINLDMQAMQARRITPQQVSSALQTQNTNIPGGSVTQGEKQLQVRTPGYFQTLDDIRNVIVSQRGTTPVYLRDVAEVVDDFKSRDTITRLNGQDSVVVNVRKQSGTNTAAVVASVKKGLEPVLKAHPELELVISADQSVQVEKNTQGAIEDLLWGSLLASLVVLFFFRDLRNTLVTMAGLPVIMIASLFFMNLLGIGLNQLSLLGLALVVGLVIDDAIVVRENILRWLQKGYKPHEAASLGTNEVVLPVLATSAAILAVFVPVAYAEGIIGRFFRDFGLTVAITIVISTFESLTMAPMLSAYFFRAGENEEREIKDSHEHEMASHGWFTRVYAVILNWTLRFRWLTLLFATLIVAGSIYSVRFINTAFVPKTEQHLFNMNMALPGGTPLEVTRREAIKVENILRSHPEAVAVFTSIGTTGAPEKASFTVKLRDDSVSQDVIDAVRKPLANVPGLSFVTGGGPGGANTDITINVLGTSADYNALGAEAAKLSAALTKIPGIVEVQMSYKPGRPEMRLDVDRQRAAQLGLSTAQIGATIRTLINGDVVSTYRGEGNEADIRVQLQESNRTSQDDIMNINLLSPSGQLVPVRNVAQVSFAAGPNQIAREDRQAIINISANVMGRGAPETTADVNKLLASLKLPDGMQARLGGNAQTQADSFRNLSLALLLSVVFIYMVLASQFGSFIQPLLIMIAMPLAIIGALLALLLTRRPMDLTAFIGFIMLMGLVVKNSILLVDFANRARDEGADATEAMRRAGPVRLRPILMTSFAMILAMIPVALGFSAGGEFRAAMAVAIMGGLITSTFLTLVIVPVAYSLVVGFQEWLAAKSAARRAAREQKKAEARRQPPTLPDGTAQAASD